MLTFLQKLRVVTVEPVLLIFMTASFIQMDFMQDFIRTKICLHSEFRDSCTNLTNSSKTFVQTETSYWLRYTNFAFSFPAIFSSLYFGSWCCLYGPKLPMILPCLGAIIGNGINVALAWYESTNVAYLLISQFVSGILGGSICVIMASTTYLSLIVSVHSRTMRFSILESTIFIGGTIGPFIAGEMVKRTSHFAVFLLLLAMNVVLTVYVIIRIENIRPQNFKQISHELPKEIGHDQLSETDGEDIQLQPQPSPSYSCRELFSPRHFIDTITVCFRKRERSKRDFIVLLLLSVVVVMLCTAGEMNTSYLFSRDDPLNWDFTKYTYYSGVKHAVSGLALLVGMPLLRHLSHPRDTSIAIMGIISKMAGLALLSFSVNSFMMFTVPFAAMFCSFPMPALRSLLSKLLEPNEHGKLFAFVAAAEQVCFLLGSVIFNSLYPTTLSFFHGFVFIFSVALLIIPLSIIGWIHTLSKRYHIRVLPEDDGYSHVDGS